MKQKLKVSVSGNPQTSGVVTCRCRSIRERLLSLLLGTSRRVAVLIPGDSIAELSVCSEGEGGHADGNE